MHDQSASIESAYVVRGDVSTESITDSLLSILPVRRDGIGRHRFTVLDTFDARLRRAGARLTHSGRRRDGAFTVAWQPCGERLAMFDLAEPPGFVWDVPPGPLHQGLAPIVGVRRILAQADAEAHGSQLEVLDDRRKTVARVRIQSGRVRRPASRRRWEPLPTIVTLTGLRGYEETYRRLIPVIESRPGITSCPEGLYGVILDRAGATGVSTRTISLSLAPTTRADIAARQIHRMLLEVLRANEAGVRADLDTEFLHDFRVALRRMRSLLGQLKHVFPPAVVEHFAEELSWIARLTGPARDIDVLTLAIRTTPSHVTATEFGELMAFLQRTRQRARRPLLEAMDSRRYRRLLADWAAFVEQPPANAFGAPNAGAPVVEVVARRAWRLCRRLADHAEVIHRRSSAQQLHDLRITAKKLRYLIDITPGFYDPGDLERVVSALKRLQAVLGDFNDARVQELQFVAFRRLLADGASPVALGTLGKLAEDRRRIQERLRIDVAEQLARFRGRATQSACRRAFKLAVATESEP